MVTEYGRIHTDGSRSGGQMAVITRKAHMAMIEVLAEWGLEPRNATAQQLAVATTEALCRAIDQQEDLRQPTQSDDEAYELGMRDGYESAVQDIDMLTGGDGEYCCGGERHCPDPDSMKARIAERFNSQPTQSDAVVKLLETMRERCAHPCRSEKAELGCDCDAARQAAVMLRQPTQSDALRERCLEAAAIAAWNIRQLTQSDSLADKSDDYAIGYLSVLLERELYEDGWIIGEDLAEKLAEIAVQTVRQPTQSDALQAENEQLRHDLERQMTIANEHVNEVERLREKIKNIKEAWDWWQLDTYDRCASVVEDAINADLEE